MTMQPGRAERRRVLNMAQVRAFSMGDANLEREVFGLFLADLPVTYQAVAEAATEADWRAWLHRLKGLAMGLGAERLCDATKLAEALPFAASLERAAALDAVCREIAAVIEAVDTTLAEPRPAAIG